MPGYSVSAGGGGPSGADSSGGFSSPFTVNNGTQGCTFCNSGALVAAAAVAVGLWFFARKR